MHILLTRPLEDCKEMIIKFKSLGTPSFSYSIINHRQGRS
jgi:hypothetical protein